MKNLTFVYKGEANNSVFIIEPGSRQPKLPVSSPAEIPSLVYSASALDSGKKKKKKKKKKCCEKYKKGKQCKNCPLR